jgi:hypothetical protein
MDMRKRAKHSRDRLPLFTRRWIFHKRHDGTRYKICTIKVAHTGGSRGGPRWIGYARYLWEQLHGPVPRGKRVFQRDGDLSNFRPSNLIVGNASDAALIFCHSDPVKSAANYRKCSEGAAKFNRERSRLLRSTSILLTHWYEVDVSSKTILNNPKRMRHQLTGQYTSTGAGWVGWSLGFPKRGALNACILAVLWREPQRVLSTAQILSEVNSLRLEIGLPPVAALTMPTATHELAKAREIIRCRPGRYRINMWPLRTRGPVCPYRFVRGSVLVTDPRYAGYRLELPSVPAREVV